MTDAIVTLQTTLEGERAALEKVLAAHAGKPVAAAVEAKIAAMTMVISGLASAPVSDEVLAEAANQLGVMRNRSQGRLEKADLKDGLRAREEARLVEIDGLFAGLEKLRHMKNSEKVAADMEAAVLPVAAATPPATDPAPQPELSGGDETNADPETEKNAQQPEFVNTTEIEMTVNQVATDAAEPTLTEIDALLDAVGGSGEGNVVALPTSTAAVTDGDEDAVLATTQGAVAGADEGEDEDDDAGLLDRLLDEKFPDFRRVNRVRYGDGKSLMIAATRIVQRNQRVLQIDIPADSVKWALGGDRTTRVMVLAKDPKGNHRVITANITDMLKDISANRSRLSVSFWDEYGDVNDRSAALISGKNTYPVRDFTVDTWTAQD